MDEVAPRTGTWRNRIYHLLEPAPGDPLPERVFNFAMVALIALNVIAVCLQTVTALFADHATSFVLFEAFSVTLFSIELVLRLWSCVEDPRYAGAAGRFKYLFHPLTACDVLAIVPFYLAFFGIPLDLRWARVARILRIFVVLRLVRYSKALRTLFAVFWRQKEELLVTLAIGFVLLLFASGTMYHLEHEAQPTQFSSIPASMWWGVITLATVGYGDVYPITPLGRVMGGLFAVIGVGLFALPAGIIATGFAEELRRREVADEVCPHCGRGPEAPQTDVNTWADVT